MLTQSEELETQFQALMQKAFKGELTGDFDHALLDGSDEPGTNDLQTVKHI